jgi:hypothetical protein
MKNLHLIPTDKPSRLGYLTKKGKEVFKDLRFFGRFMPTIMDGENQNVYITSDEEIKEGEYGLSRLGEIIKFHSGYDYRYYAKVILTTDKDLIKDGVQAIDDEFLEWFVKNPSCESVEVEKFFGFAEDYLIIIPQEEPKQECTCGVCDNCEEQETTQILKEAKENALKQETIEEALDRKYPLTTLQHLQLNTAIRTGFEEGAQWQAERMYSEGDKIMKFLDTEKELKLSDAKTIERIKWYFETYFEQFKKK